MAWWGRSGNKRRWSIAALASGALAIAAALTIAATPDGPELAGAPPGDAASDCETEPQRRSGPLAFATAEGFGKYARGGRGGAVFIVDTLADSGPGSLRACAEATGRRTCVFSVSGTIAVDSWISVQSPYLTIAGQTSPGGIAIKVNNSQNTPLLVQTHDVIIRHLRLRPGPAKSDSENIDTIQVSGGAHDVILDHLSTSWPTDEGINIVGDGKRRRACMDTRDITVQWSIMSEGLDHANRGAHSRGTYFGYGARNISFHHNLIASNVRRNPLLNTREQFDMINNVVFNSGRYNGEFYTRFGALGVNAVGNVGIIGPSSDKTSRLYLIDYFRDYPADFAIYLRDNIDIHRPANRGDERLVLEPGDWRYVRQVPVGPLSLPTASITAPAQAYRDVMAFAGATRPRRDSADVRLLADMAACRGQIIDDPVQVGGWPKLAGPPAAADADQDGMADAWEISRGLSPADPTDRNAPGTGGYTNLENYLGALAGDDAGGRAGTAPGPAPEPSCGFAVADAGPMPEIRISATPASIAPGESAMVRWEGTDIEACKAFGVLLMGQGTRIVRPAATTTYAISCTGTRGGDAIDAVIVEVRPRRPATR